MQILYSFIVAIFFSGLFFYLINFALLPYNSEKIVDIQNLIIFTISLISSISSIFVFFHSAIDKLFFRKFYEKPRIMLAVRRGLFLGIHLSGLIWMRIFGFWFWHIVLLYSALILLFETLFLSIDMKRKQRREKKLKEEQIQT